MTRGNLSAVTRLRDGVIAWWTLDRDTESLCNFPCSLKEYLEAFTSKQIKVKPKDARVSSYLSSRTPDSSFLGNFWADKVIDQLSWISSYETLGYGELTRVRGLMLSRYLMNSAEIDPVSKVKQNNFRCIFWNKVYSRVMWEFHNWGKIPQSPWSKAWLRWPYWLLSFLAPELYTCQIVISFILARTFKVAIVRRTLSYLAMLVVRSQPSARVGRCSAPRWVLLKMGKNKDFPKLTMAPKVILIKVIKAMWGTCGKDQKKQKSPKDLIEIQGRIWEGRILVMIL